MANDIKKVIELIERKQSELNKLLSMAKTEQERNYYSGAVHELSGIKYIITVVWEEMHEKVC